MSLISLIRSDLRRYLATGARSRIVVVLTAQGFWASTVYRISHHLVVRVKSPIVLPLVKFCCAASSKVVEIVTGISIDYTCEIGEGLYFPHYGNIFVGGKIGRNCNICQGVTLGFGGRGDQFGFPTIGDRVQFGPNSVVTGKITIGNDVLIGPCTSVSRSFPDRAVLVGNPAKLLWYEGSFDAVHYDGMHEDPDRVASLQLSTSPFKAAVDPGGHQEPAPLV